MSKTTEYVKLSLAW